MTSTRFSEPEVLIQATNIIIYRLPQSMVEPYVLTETEMTEVERALHEDTSSNIQDVRIPDGTIMLKEIPQEVLAPYQLSEEDVAALGNPDDVKGYFMTPSLIAVSNSDKYQSLVSRLNSLGLGVQYISEGN